MLIKFIKQSDDTCDYCKNLIECKGEGCECWYCLGHSYPAEVCQVIYDKTPMADSLV